MISLTAMTATVSPYRENAWTISRSEMRPRITSPLVTTRAPTFLARNQSAAFLILESGPIFATSAPFCLKIVSTVITISLCLPTVIEFTVSVHLYSPHRERELVDYDPKRRIVPTRRVGAAPLINLLVVVP